jgi:hypothetical protein
VEEASLTDEERTLMGRHRLDLEQIGYRRQIRANFRGLARQEYAEDEESCFLASGDSVFELAAIEARLKEAPEPVERRRNGELEVWLPPLAGKEYLVAVDPAGGGSEGITRRPRCWRWRRACSARSLPGTWAGWNWRSW